jgi:hypothetical protein
MKTCDRCHFKEKRGDKEICALREKIATYKREIGEMEAWLDLSCPPKGRRVKA